MNKITPILKWAGGKRQLLPHILPLIPQNYKRYFEPFVGAGAVLLELQPSEAIINDTNSELINVYKVIKNQPKDLIFLLREYESKHNKDYFYTVRNIDRNIPLFEKLSPLEKAARTIYLNRTCYNGLYRVNQSGFFNTPIGHNSHVQIVNEEGILDIHNYLVSSHVIILSTDYREALTGITREDFVFLDPPYYPMNRDSFLRYDSSHFGIAEQEQLKHICDELTQKGIRFVETNSDCPEVRELYSQYNLRAVDARRCINAKPEGRHGKEIIICNYEENGHDRLE